MIETKELSQSLINDSRFIIETALGNAYTAINVAMVQRNWMLGKRIAEEELQGENRAAYGKQIVTKLSDILTA